MFRWLGERTRQGPCEPSGRRAFRFPDGFRLAPDAAWVDSRRWAKAKKSGERFPVFAPEFVIEVRSPNDRIGALRDKMEDYIANGVLLGWLIDPTERTATIYRPGRPSRVLEHPATVDGEGPVAEFVLQMDRIFAS